MLERRPAVADDEAFLRGLYGTTRPDLAGWEDDAREQLVDLQLAAQRSGWESAFPGSSDELLLLDGRPVGRLWVAWLPEACVVVDIGLLPESRRQGHGTWIVGEVAAEAVRRGVPVRATVARTNATALAFWSRLGFGETGRDEVHVRLERRSARLA